MQITQPVASNLSEAPIDKKFAHAVFTLLGGNVIAQIIPYLSTIILAHLFNPAAFGYLALFSSIASTVAIVATGRYELAVLLPKKDHDALALVFFGVLLALGVSIVLSGFFLLLPQAVFFYHHLKYFKFALPVAVFAIAVNQILIQWFLRQGRYRYISFARFIQTSATAIISCLLGWYSHERGLLMGYVWGWTGSAIFLSILTICLSSFKKIPTRKQIRLNAVRFSDHALFGTIPAVLNALSTFILVFIINHHYGSNYAGQYNLSLQFVYGPISLIAGAIGQVVFRESSQILINNQSDKALFRLVTKYLSYSALIYGVTVILGAEKFFNMFFGPLWHASSQITIILAVSYSARLIVSTLSCFLLAHNALRVNGLWQASYFIMLCSLYFMKPENPLFFFYGLASLDLILFAAYFFLIKKIVYKKLPVSHIKRGKSTLKI